MTVKINKMLFTILIFSGIAAGFSIYFTGILTTYDKYDDLTDTEKNAIGSLNVISKVNESVTQPLKEKIEAAQTNPLGALSFFIDSVIQSVKIFIQIPGILVGLVSNIGVLLGPLMPSFLGAIITAIILIGVLLAIVAVIMRYDA